MKAVYVITGINPEPWVAPETSTGRKGGKFYTQHYTSAGLKAYQEAVKEELVRQNGHVPPEPLDDEMQVTFWLWRELAQSDDKDQMRNVADATNMQKALEDALQGILYKNDKRNVDVNTIIVEQSKTTMPHIEIEIRTGLARITREPPIPFVPTPHPFPVFTEPQTDLF